MDQTTEQPQVKKHKILDKKVLTCFVTFLGFIVIGNILQIPTIFLESESGSLVTSVIVIVTAFALLLGYQWIFRSEFDGLLNWPSSNWKIIIPALLFGVMNATSIIEEGIVTPLHIALLSAAAPGIAEEVIFRGVPCSNWMRVSCEESAIIPCALLTSLIFSLTHALNALFGAALSATILQLVYAFGLGFVFAAVVLRTGSLVPSMLAHTFIDWMAFITMDMTQQGLVTKPVDFLSPDALMTLGFGLILIVYGFYLLRPAKRAEIVELWKKKFSKA